MLSQTYSSTVATKRKSKGIDLKPYLIGISIPLTLFALYIGYRVYSSDKLLIPVSVFALMAGLFFESRRVTDSWGTFIGVVLFSFILSFFAFLPGKQDTNYFLDNHIEMWPYVFCFFFIVFSTAFAGDKVIPKLTEGITLMQSIAVIYWVVDTGFIGFNHAYLIPFGIFGLCFATISFYNAFSYDELKRKTRLTLSIWSSLIMLLFAIDNIYQVYQISPIETTNNFLVALYIAAQFFLLGISSIYIVQNFFMLVEFLPDKEKFFNEEYYKDLKKLKQQHISRYSTEQVTKLHSFLCVVIMGTIFGLNYYLNFLPRDFVIWTIFVLFPLALRLFDNVTGNILQ